MRNVRLFFDFFEMNSANLSGNFGRYDTRNKIDDSDTKTWSGLFIKNTRTWQTCKRKYTCLMPATGVIRWRRLVLSLLMKRLTDSPHNQAAVTLTGAKGSWNSLLGSSDAHGTASRLPHWCFKENEAKLGSLMQNTREINSGNGKDPMQPLL